MQNLKHVEIKNDPIIKSQQYCLISYIFNNKGLMKKCNLCGIKIRGVFKTFDDAQQYVDVIKSYDNKFDIYCGDVVGKCIPIFPTENDVKEIKYDQKELTELMNSKNMKKPLDDKYNPFVFTSGDDDELYFKNEDKLSEDQPLNNQNYALVSFYTPELVKNCSIYCMKIRGVVDSIDNANKLLKKLQQYDDNAFQIFYLPVGKWCPLNFHTKLNHDPNDLLILNELVGRTLKDREREFKEYEERHELGKKQKLHEVYDESLKNTKVDDLINKIKSEQQQTTTNPTTQTDDVKTHEVNLEDVIQSLDKELSTDKQPPKKKPFIYNEKKDGHEKRKRLQEILKSRKAASTTTNPTPTNPTPTTTELIKQDNHEKEQLNNHLKTTNINTTKIEQPNSEVDDPEFIKFKNDFNLKGCDVDETNYF